MNKMNKNTFLLVVVVLVIASFLTGDGLFGFLNLYGTNDPEQTVEQTMPETNGDETEQQLVDNPESNPDNQPQDQPDNQTDSEAETQPKSETDSEAETDQNAIDVNGSFYSKDDVALFIHTYQTLPENFVTKGEAEAAGWEGGSVERYIDGAAIGGDIFHNYERLLPEQDGRVYKECDIDTFGQSSRGAKRIVFSNDGLIFYTDDHYDSFEQLY